MRVFMPFKSLSARYPKLGPIVCVSTFQYFLVQYVVSLRWAPGYSLSRNTISDLGNTVCGEFNAKYVCSPLHSLMNVSFVALGLAMFVGSALLYHSHQSSRGRSVGFMSIAIGGVGAVLVGVFPENSVSALHGIGAALPFVVGNVGVLVLGLSLNTPVALRFYTLMTGTVGLLSLCFYASGHYLGFGEGGIERWVAYPQTVWLIVLGIYLLATQTFKVQTKPKGVNRWPRLENND